MADSGRIERAWLEQRIEAEKVVLDEHPELGARERARGRIEVLTDWLDAESTHYSELERLAGELEARAEKLRALPKSDQSDADWGEGASVAFREAASLLRDSVPASLTRGEN